MKHLLRGILTVGCLIGAGVAVHSADNTPLRIGTTGTLVAKSDPGREKTAIDTLRDFIKSQTGLENIVEPQEGWRALAKKLESGEVQVGVFQGHEFCWASHEHEYLVPLAITVNVYRYQTAHVIVRDDSNAKTFADLRDSRLSLPEIHQPYLRLFVEFQCRELKSEPEKFFSKILSPDNVEDAIDDVVDGHVDAAVIHRLGLETYKRRKPARYAKVKELIHSKPFLPAVVAYRKNGIDKKTLERFQHGIESANQKEKGRTLLNLFKITAFEAPPSDFKEALKECRGLYPPPKE